MKRLTGKNNDYCFTICGGERKHIREDCNIYKVCFERQIYERLKHYEDLEESGRLVVLPEGYTIEGIAECANQRSLACPSDIGLPSPLHCNHTSCYKCWEAALKGESNGD